MSLTYRVSDKLTKFEAGRASELHENAFTELNKLTVQRHLMNRGELADVFGDDRLRKYTVWDDEDDSLIGLSLQTNRLEAHPLVSVPFFEEHFPEHVAALSCWYITSVCVDVERADRSVFPALIRQMMQPIRATRGMGVLDYSSHIMTTTHLDTASKRYIAGCAPLDQVHDLGFQQHVAYTFNWPAT